LQDWLCKVFSAFDWYTMLAIIAWMFVEGLFLHGRVTIAVFNVNPPFKAYYFVGWGEHRCRQVVIHSSSSSSSRRRRTD